MRIELAMNREDQRDIVGDLQIFRADTHALRFELGDLLDEMMRIEDDAVADHRQLAGAHNARRQERELVGDAVDNERVAGIVAALEAHDHVRLERQPIDDLAFALIAPLGADYDHIRHRARPSPRAKSQQKTRRKAGLLPGPLGATKIIGQELRGVEGRRGGRSWR